MKKIIHKEILVCDCCKKEVGQLFEHSIIGEKYDGGSFAIPFLGYEDYKIELCKDCEERLAKIIQQNFAKVSFTTYSDHVDITEVKQ